MKYESFFAALLGVDLAGRGFESNNSSSTACRYLPSDPEWPSEDSWAALNESVDGRLIRVVPLGAACYGPTNVTERCAFLQYQLGANWIQPKLQ